MARALITVHRTGQADLFEVRTLIGHPMETGFRRDADGQLLARNILRRLTCRLGSAEGEVVFDAELHPAIAANPYVAFFVRAAAGARLWITWRGDQDFSQTETVTLAA